MLMLLTVCSVFTFCYERGSYTCLNGSCPVAVPDLISALAFISTLGVCIWWIHRTLNGEEEGASSRWLETGWFNIASMLFWLFLWSGDFDHDTYFPVFATVVGINLLVAFLAFWMRTRT
jgi:hypothetical protein